MNVFSVSSPEPAHRVLRGRRVFTLEHANRTLPLVTRIVTDIVDQHKQVCVVEERCQVPHADCLEEEIDSLREQYISELERLRELRDELTEIGCQLKDWRRGIVDFLSFFDNRPVELCWRLGEKHICHWHEIDSGFRGREPIEEECADRFTNASM